MLFRTEPPTNTVVMAWSVAGCFEGRANAAFLTAMYISRFPECPDCADLHPGDLIIDRYMPNCTHQQRHEARMNLYGFVRVLYRAAERRAREDSSD